MKPIIPDAALGQHIAVLGKTRSGKSSVMRGLVEGLLEREQPVCIVDPKGDWWGIKLSKDGKRPGYPVVIFGGEHADVPINAHAGAHVAELFATGNRPCLIDLGGWMVGDRTRFWIDFASNLFKHTKGMRWLAVDEIHNFAPKGKIMDPDAGKALHWANRLASEGLGKGVHMIFASQRPQKVHNDTLTSAETLIAMRVLHPSDRGAVSDWIKGCGDLELGARVLNTLAEMKRGEGWVWSPEIGFGPERVQFPMFKTYDSFRPQSAEETQALKGWAEVDLEDVKAKLATVVKEAEAKDPAKLQAEIRRLNAELAKKPAAAPAKGAPAGPRREDLAMINALRKALEDAMKVIVEINAKDFFKAGGEAIDKGEIEKALAGAAQTVAKMVERHLDQRSKDFDSLKRDAQRVMNRVKGLLETDLTVKVDVRHNESFTVSPAAPRAPATRPAARLNGEQSTLPGSQQRILDALAALEGMGIEQPKREQLALWAEVSPTSGGYFNNLGSLRTAGLIEYPAGGTVALTEFGRAAARATDPMTVEEMQASLCEKVGNAKAAILRALIEIYPKEISRDDLAEKIDVSATSGGYFNNLGALRTLGVIDYPSPGKVAALPVLFLES